MFQTRKILVTGGTGFIGSAFIRYSLSTVLGCEKLVNLDLLTYAANLESVKGVEKDPRYFFIQGDVCNERLVEELCLIHQINTIVHFAAETHVDRSIFKPLTFFETNVRGTLALLEVVRRHPQIHFHHVSTDEVYGSLGHEGKFDESSPYAPNSPYAASKAASDHFVRAYAHTYGLSMTLSHSSNNYGPFQNEEKFIPRMITHCLKTKPLPLFGHGLHVRDWLYVEDHAEALWMILENGKLGNVYDIGGGCEMTNLDMLRQIIRELSIQLDHDSSTFEALISHVDDRPGHDFRYALNTTKIHRELGWFPRHSLTEGLRKTIEFYLSIHNSGCHASP